MASVKSGDLLFYVVAGRGEFPLDMLRYDYSFPFDSADSFAMGDSSRPRFVVLAKISQETIAERYWPGKANSARWTSFGWTVMSDPTTRKNLVTTAKWDLRRTARAWFRSIYPEASS